MGRLGKPFDAKLIAVALAAMAAASPAGAGPDAGRPPTPIVAAFNEAPPMAYTNDKGRLDGALFRVARSLFAVAGLPWSGGAYPAPRLVKGMSDGSFNFSMLVRMPALSECCLFSSEPVLVQEPTIYFRAGTPPVASREELSGRSLIVVNGFTYAGMINHFRDPASRVSLEVAETLDSAFRMLAAGRADYLLSYEANARTVLAARPIAGLESRVIGRIPVHLVLWRGYPDAPAVMARLERLMKAMDVPALMAEE